MSDNGKSVQKKEVHPEKTTVSDSTPDEAIIELQPIISKLKDKKDQQRLIKVITAISISSRSFSGPVPPPEMLAGYNDCVEGGADRILKMAENQSEHRISVEKEVITKQLEQSRNGQYFGFGIGIFGIVASVFAAYCGHETFACVLGGSTLLGLVTVFVVGRVGQRNDLNNK